MKELISLFENYSGEKNLQCIKIKGEGSNRKYFRLISSGLSVIGVKGESKEENEAFIALSKQFSKKSLPIPKVLAVSTDRMYYLQEDLGDISLFQYIRNGIESGIFNSYETEMLKKTIKLLPEIQYKGAENLDFSVCYPQPEFDKRTIMWDLNYFKYCFLKTIGIDFSELELEKDFEQMCHILLQDNTSTFLYRDFQSRNVMMHEDKPFFIDFQGGRKGPVFYDVASFIWQAKANFPETLKEELLQAYFSALRNYTDMSETYFRKQLRHFVLFRTLQVLGAYGFRGYFEKKSHFLESIPFAIRNLKILLKENYAEYPYLCKLLKKITLLDSLQQEEKAFKNSNLEVKVFSFSYKKGIPEDISGNGGGYVFDCRAIHNPGKYEQYKMLTGIDTPVIDFLEQDGEILSFLQNVYALVDCHIKKYIERGFTNLMLSFGCTGGQHRSVYSAEHTAKYIAKKFGIKVVLIHREQGIEKNFNK